MEMHSLLLFVHIAVTLNLYMKDPNQNILELLWCPIIQISSCMYVLTLLLAHIMTSNIFPVSLPGF